MHGFRRSLLIFLTIALVAMIAFFSSDTGSKSEGKSREVAVFFLRIWNKEFDALSSAEREALIQKAQLPVRKAAHATEFFALGSVMVLLFAELRREDWRWRPPRWMRRISSLSAVGARASEMWGLTSRVLGPAWR